jgi:hypothetical protein
MAIESSKELQNMNTWRLVYGNGQWSNKVSNFKLKPIVSPNLIAQYLEN